MTEVKCHLDTQWLGYWGKQPTGTACGKPSCAEVRFTCKHEFLTDLVPVCRDCALDVQQSAGRITCKRCWNSDTGHACYMHVIIDWPSGQETKVQEARRGAGRS